MKNKEIAQNFLALASKGNSREAFKLYVGSGFKHHNIHFKGDGETLMLAMEENAKHAPDKIFKIKRAIHDGDLVAVHSHVQPNPQHLGFAVMHIFKFKDNKIIELWDFGQEVPAETVNENGMF